MTTTVRPGSEIARPAPPTNQTHTTSSLSTVTFAQHQPPISTQDEHRNSVAAAVGLIALSLIPVLAGAFRVNELMSRPEITADNARFVASPIPVTVHIVSVTVYSLLGALQFVPLLRRGRHNWHRIAGRILVPAGALVALTGLWMNFSILARLKMASRW